MGRCECAMSYALVKMDLLTTSSPPGQIVSGREGSCLRDAVSLLLSFKLDLSIGSHTQLRSFLTCEVAHFTATGGHEWRLIGIASL